MRFKFAGNKFDDGAVVFKNNESTLTMLAGAPVVLDFGATTEIGCMAKTCVSLAAAEQGNFYGINLSGPVLPGQYGESQVFGYCASARTLLTTRTATDATWASIAAGSLGEYLTMQTGTGTGGYQALIRVGTAAMTVAQFARLAETFASTDTQASSLGPQTQTAWTTTRKIFLRAM